MSTSRRRVKLGVDGISSEGGFGGLGGIIANGGGGAPALEFESYAALKLELDTQALDGLEASLYTIGFKGVAANLIGTWRYFASISEIVLMGELNWAAVTDSQFGEQDATSPTTGTTRIMQPGHSLPLAGTLSIRALTGVGGVNLATSVDYTRAGDTLTFTAGDPVPAGTAVDDQFFEDGGEFGHLEGRLVVDPSTLAFFDSGLKCENGSLLLDDIGLLNPEANTGGLGIFGVCDTVDTLSENGSVCVIGYSTVFGPGRQHCGGALITTGQNWRRGTTWNTRTTPSTFGFGSSGLVGELDYTDVCVGLGFNQNDPLNTRTGSTFASGATTPVTFSLATLASVNTEPEGGGFVIISRTVGGTDLTLKCKRFTWSFGGFP